MNNNSTDPLMNSLIACILGPQEDVHLLLPLFSSSPFASVLDLQGMSDYIKYFGALAHNSDSLKVRVISVKALGALARHIDATDQTAIHQYQSVIPYIMTVLGQVIESCDEKNLCDIAGVFYLLLFVEAPLLAKDIPDLVLFLIRHSRHQSLPGCIRDFTLSALKWTVKNKLSYIRSGNLAAYILDSLLPIIADSIVDSEGIDTLAESSLNIITILSMGIPVSDVYSIICALVDRAIVSPHPNCRRAALMMLDACIEALADFLAPHMQHIWSIIDSGITDPDAGVRQAACRAVGSLCKHCLMGSAEHPPLLPAVLNLFDEPITRMTACTTLDYMLENLPRDIQPHMESIMGRLLGSLDTATVEIQELLVGAIGSAAHSSAERFTQFFDPTVTKMRQFLNLDSLDKNIELKGLTMVSLGAIAKAVGKETFRPYFADLMKLAISGVDSGNPTLSQSSFVAFDELSAVFREEFAPYLPTVAPAILKSLQQSEPYINDALLENSQQPEQGMSEDKVAKGDTLSKIALIEARLQVDMETGDMDEVFNPNHPICIEKEKAADAVGSIFIATKHSFWPYIEQTTSALFQATRHFREGIRQAAYRSLFSMIKVCYQLSSSIIPLQPNVRQAIDHICPELFEAFGQDNDKTSVTIFLNGLAEIIHEVGPNFVEYYIRDIFTAVVIILEQKSFCQLGSDNESFKSIDDQGEVDSRLIHAAVEVVAALAAAFRTQFKDLFEEFFPRIMKYYGKSGPVSNRIQIVRSMSDIICDMSDAITPFTQPILHLLSAALGDPDIRVQRSGAFALGILLENSEADLSSEYLYLLAALRPLFVVPDGAAPDHFKARDNAAGAVARMILKNAQALPLDQVLPDVIYALPLRNDYYENVPVFRAVLHLVQSNSRALNQFSDHLTHVFSHVLNHDDPEQFGQETRLIVLELMDMFKPFQTPRL